MLREQEEEKYTYKHDNHHFAKVAIAPLVNYKEKQRQREGCCDKDSAKRAFVFACQERRCKDEAVLVDGFSPVNSCSHCPIFVVSIVVCACMVKILCFLLPVLFTIVYSLKKES